MNLIEESFQRLYPEKNLGKQAILKYSGKFKPYNASVRYNPNQLTFNLSKDWRAVDQEIQIGLIQALLVKVFREKRKTVNIEIYNIFMKRLWTVAPKNRIDSVLMQSFDRVNKVYFNGFIEVPNLVWGAHTTTKLGCYEYSTDTISISSVFKDQPPEFVDYVMYHEMLHKKLQYKNTGMKTMHHTAEFKFRERQFRDSRGVEKKIQKLVKGKKIRSIFGWRF